MDFPHNVSALLEPLTGFWGRRTSTLDWCERNYEMCHYIAEFWNTISNFAMVALALFGIITTLKFRQEKRFVISHLCLMVVGWGSFAFHGTLLYEMQLLDELPMIYGACIMGYFAMEMKPHSQYGKKLAVPLFIYAIFFTVVYVIDRHPLFHQITYGVFAVLITIRCIHLFREIQYDRQAKSLLLQAVCGYLLGFTLWNIDSLSCHFLRNTRSHLHKTGIPFLGPLLELHAWWHVLTGYGTYAFIVFTAYTRYKMMNVHGEIRSWIGVIPYLYTDPELSDVSSPASERLVRSSSPEKVAVKSSRSRSRSRSASPEPASATGRKGRAKSPKEERRSPSPGENGTEFDGVEVLVSPGVPGRARRRKSPVRGM